MAVVEAAVAAIQAGKPVVLPTDTVYGLCASPYREDPVRRVYLLKGKPETEPSAILCSDLDMLLECVPELRGRAGVIARALLPGPFTLVLPNPARRYRWMAGQSPETIGVRVAELEGDAAEVLDRVGAVMATSANLHGGADPKTLDDVPDEILSACGAVVDRAVLSGTPSTVIDFTGSEPKVLREGVIPADEALERVAALAG